MKFKFVLAILVVIFYANVANAQNNLDKITGLSTTTASVAYSLRLLSSSYSGPLVRIKVNTSYYDVYPDQTTNKFSLSSKISAAISNYNDGVVAFGSNTLSSIISGSTNATVSVWYDQSGNGIHVFSNLATAKIITSGAIITLNGQPTITFLSNSNFASTTTVNYSTQNAATINAVAQNINSTSDYAGIISTGPNGGWGLSYNPSNVNQPGFGSDKFYGYFVDGNGGLNASSNELTTTASIITGLVNKSSVTSSLYINSVLKNTTTQLRNPGNGTTDLIYVGKRGNCCSDRTFLGNISETMIFPKNLSSNEQTALELSQSIFLTPSVSITSSASGSICAGTNVVFTATTTGISSPTFQWYKNSTLITGANSSTFSTTTLANNDQVYVSVALDATSASLVSSNLIANLDAGNASSYGGTGTTWTDLTGNGNKVTLNGAGYSNVNGGGIAFGTSKYGTQTLSSPPFNGDFTWSTILKAPNYNTNSWDFLYNVGGYTGLNIALVTGKPHVSWGTWFSDNINVNGESMMTIGNYYMLTFVRSGNAISFYLQATPYGISSTVSATIPSTSPLIAIGPGGEWWENGIMNVMLLYNRALTQSEITQNYNSYVTRFGLSAAGLNSNKITTTINPVTPIITMIGDGCVNRTTLTTSTGFSSYIWYNDNAVITGATSNSYTPTSSGSYQVQVSNGTCTNISTITMVNDCAVGADGKMMATSNTSLIISPEGGANFGTGRDFSGKLYNTTIFTTTTGTIGSTTAVLGGVISTTNAVTSSIGIMYSTDANFGTYSTTTIQSNVAAGSYSSTITGLTSSTNYFAKSFIVNKAGTTYGSIVNFTTAAPSLVSDGLVLNLDAGNTSSYSGSGTTWTDLSGKGNNGTLYNSVSYNSSNQGSLVFNGNGTNDGSRDPYVQLPMSTDFDFGSGDFTVEMWAYTTSGNIASDFVVINSASSSYAAVRLEYYNGDLLVVHSYDGVSHASGSASASFAFNLNVWNHIVVSRISGTAKVYVNGVEKASYSLPGSLLAQQNSRIGSLPTHPGGKNYSGNIATTRFYKGKGLTTAEVSYNFNLLKSRFGL